MDLKAKIKKPGERALWGTLCTVCLALLIMGAFFLPKTADVGSETKEDGAKTQEVQTAAGSLFSEHHLSWLSDDDSNAGKLEMDRVGVVNGDECLENEDICLQLRHEMLQESALFQELKAQADREERNQQRKENFLRCSKRVTKNDRVFVFPFKPAVGERVRFVAVTRSRRKRHTFWVIDEKGNRIGPKKEDSWGHYPKAHVLSFSSLAPGRYTAVFSSQDGRGESNFACIGVDVKRQESKVEGADKVGRERPLVETGVWEIRSKWTPHMEDLFSVFVERLFKIQRGGHNSWRPLHQPLKDPYRNILYNALGWNEDIGIQKGAMRLYADCADAPFALRAYFAWKMGLPFLFNRCSRGSSITGPICEHKRDNLTSSYDYVEDPVERFNLFVWKHVNMAIHSGNGRTLPNDDESDMYPVALEQNTLRPGIIFIDAGGHFILISERYKQTKSSIGALYGVDAHPDLSVTSKQFAQGTFVFNPRVPTDGFKAFRPVVYKDGQIRFMTNREINESGGYLKWSQEGARIADAKDFYRKIGGLLNPKPLEPMVVLEANIKMLENLTKTRVEAVNRGLNYMKKKGWATMGMPDGKEIFQTTGPWEVYSTPARDMRYLIALDNVFNLPKTILNNPDVYALPPDVGKRKLKKQFTERLHELLHSTAFHYKRSDGSSWMLTLWDIMNRREKLEIAYNPNDCVEVRWGARPGSEEVETCNRRAPITQRRRMAQMRRWFRTRYRPTAEE